MAGPRIAVLATLDTKLEETRFVADQIRSNHAEPVVINLGTTDVDDPLVDITQSTVREASGHPQVSHPTKVQLMESAAAGAHALLREGIANGRFNAAIAIGGGQGSWMTSAALRDLPVGFPRLLVSTAGRDVGQYTGFSDITSVFSITDVAGLNPLLKRVLTTAAAGIAGMAHSTAWQDPMPAGLTAMTVYGITTPGARLVMAELERAGIETVAFHANGVGGPTMEQQIAAGTFAAVLDWSITEVADDVVGGVCAVGDQRLTNGPRMRLPQVIVPGGIDVVNFGAPETVPPHLRDHPSHAHTPEATLVRTSVDENIAIAHLVASRLIGAVSPIKVIVPLGGFSMLSEEGGSLHDPAADRAFYETIRDDLADCPAVTVTSRPEAINDPSFARHVAAEFAALLRGEPAPASNTPSERPEK
ncbi:Tm-1-like ATP-binding domain-containing protein [Tessaracoccus palaemonis]|uniref:Tm-1-like ATP-binding domain-containing protein n=1 Tax=Tessaracoccus palaemonis TaxID=2829499 RepID=A0ABX8SRC0_9ACTN|nr:Tm-1-like ATP-binding domain-containing protein [Tessaracoccus palaemonis]QXT63719.1 Tm-1-like ATP-binding domain-containing protein [Tessaracoccus palaemonis]